MLFAAGMGVGLLFWGVAEPLTHYLLIAEYDSPRDAAALALFLTNFHWGLHAWAIYALTGLVIAYFSFRRGCAVLVGGSWTLTYMVWWLAWAPFVGVFIAPISKGRTISCSSSPAW